MLKADLHVHTCFSPDSATSPEEIVDRCLETGINCLAVCDHGAIGGGLALQKIAPFKIVVGEEILTPFGDVIGFFLSDELPGKLPLEDAIYRIKEQGGIVCIPHPFDYLRSSSFCNKGKLVSVLPDIDMIEVFNARSITPGAGKQARHLINKYGKLASAGSDAHTMSELGSTYIEMPDFNDRDEFLASVAAGTIVGRRSSPLVHLVSTKNRINH